MTILLSLYALMGEALIINKMHHENLPNKVKAMKKI